MVTLKDIAKEAGVSIMTVSNVINGNTRRVSAKTAQRVREIAQRLDYVPNETARSLSKRNSNIIAVILRGEQDQNVFLNPHNAALSGTIIGRIQQQGYYSMVNIMKSEAEILQTLRSWSVEGAIFLGMFDDEIEKIYEATSVPMVFIDSYSSIRCLSNVGINDYRGGQLAAQCFLGHGHKALAFVGPPTEHIGVVQHRLAGFCDELKKRNLELRRQFIVHSDVDAIEIDKLGQEITSVREDITGIFVASDQIASFLVNSLWKRGVRIPEHISLIGFDDLLLCKQLTPPLTTISQNLTQKAQLAVELLFRQMKTPHAPAESIVLDTALVERASVSDISEKPARL